MDNDKLKINILQEHKYSVIEIISSIVFVVLAVIGMYFLSLYLNT